MMVPFSFDEQYRLAKWHLGMGLALVNISKNIYVH